MSKKQINTEDYARLGDCALSAIPSSPPDIIEWAQENVQLPTSARSKHFNISVTPWLREPIDRAVDLPTRIVTLMKPVQSGGSVFGEVLMLYWMMYWRGFLQYNWSSNKRAAERWASRIKGILAACAPVADRMKLIPERECEIDFGNIFFRMQGAFIDANLDSDSIALQINEEVHDWEPGHLKKARNRSTAIWNFKSVDISNAGTKGDQLDQAYGDGTMQQWTVKCPGCGLYHRMRTRWEDKKPELGGLRYDADKARRPGRFEYNYNILRPTIRYLMPCGFQVHNEDMRTRRGLSLNGKYEEPQNQGAELVHRSYTYDSVIVDYIDWMTLIKDKHNALRARALGDPEPFHRYKCERECIPYDEEDVPLASAATITQGIVKSRAGLAEPKLRIGQLDRQQGDRAAGDFPYWWLLIRDVKVDWEGNLHSLLVYEGKIEDDGQVILILDEHKVNHWQVVADSGDDTTYVYMFCMKYGINAIKGTGDEFFAHEGGTRRIFSPERPLHAMLNRQPNFQYIEVGGEGKHATVPDPREPLYWLYSKRGIRERLFWLRANTKFETPEDVSDEYKAHQEAEERIEYVNPSDGSRVWKWVQKKKRNDQFVNEAYAAMQIDMSGLMGVGTENK
jgi:hypothetical protein